MEDKETSSPKSGTTGKLSKLPKLSSSSSKKRPSTTTAPVNSFSGGDAVESNASPVSALPPIVSISLPPSNANATSTRIPTQSKTKTNANKVTLPSDQRQPSKQIVGPSISRQRSFLPIKRAQKKVAAAENVAIAGVPVARPHTAPTYSLANDPPLECPAAAPSPPDSSVSNPRKSLLPLPLPKKLKVVQNQNPNQNGPCSGLKLALTRPRTVSHVNRNVNVIRPRTSEYKLENISNSNTIVQNVSASEEDKILTTTSPLIPNSAQTIKIKCTPENENLESQYPEENNNKLNSTSSLQQSTTETVAEKKSKLPRRTTSKPKVDTAIKRTLSAQKNCSSIKHSKHTNLQTAHSSTHKNVGIVGSATSTCTRALSIKNKSSDLRFSYSQRFQQRQAKTGTKTGAQHKDTPAMSPKVSDKIEIELKRESKTSTLSSLPLQKDAGKTVQKQKQKGSNTTDVNTLSSDKTTSITESFILEETKVIDTAEISPSRVKYTSSKESTFTVQSNPKTKTKTKKSKLQGSPADGKKKGSPLIVGIFETPSPFLLETSESDSDFKGKSECQLEVKQSHSLKELWPKLAGGKSSSGNEGLKGVDAPIFKESFSDFEILEFPAPIKGIQTKSENTSLTTGTDLYSDGQIRSNLNSKSYSTIKDKPEIHTVQKCPQLEIKDVPIEEEKKISNVHMDQDVLSLQNSQIPNPDTSFIVSRNGSILPLEPLRTPARGSGSTHLIQFSSEDEALDIKSNNPLTVLAIKAPYQNIKPTRVIENPETVPLKETETGPTIMDEIVAALEVAVDEQIPATKSIEATETEITEIYSTSLNSSIPKCIGSTSSLGFSHEEAPEEKTARCNEAKLVKTETTAESKLALTGNTTDDIVDTVTKTKSSSTKIKPPRTKISSSVRSRVHDSPKSNSTTTGTSTMVVVPTTTKTERNSTIIEPSLVDTKKGQSHGTPSTPEITSLIIKKSNEVPATNTNVSVKRKLSKHLHSSLSPSSDNSSISSTSTDSFKSAQPSESTPSSTCSHSLRMSQTIPLPMAVSSMSLKVAKLLSRHTLLTPTPTQSASTVSQNGLPEPPSVSSVQPNSIDFTSKPNTSTVNTAIKQKSIKSEDSTKILKDSPSSTVTTKSISVSVQSPDSHESSTSATVTSLEKSTGISYANITNILAPPNGTALSAVPPATPKIQIEVPISSLQTLPVGPSLSQRVEISDVLKKQSHAVTESRGRRDEALVVATATESSKVEPHKSSCTFLKAPKSVKSGEKLQQLQVKYRPEQSDDDGFDSHTAAPIKVKVIDIESSRSRWKPLNTAEAGSGLEMLKLVPSSKDSHDSQSPKKLKHVEETKASSITIFPFPATNTPNNTSNSSQLRSTTTATSATSRTSKTPSIEMSWDALLPQLESVGNLHSACLSCRIESINSIISSHVNVNCDPFSSNNCDEPGMLFRIPETMDESMVEEIRAARRKSIQQFHLKQQLIEQVMIDDAVSMYSVGSHLEGFLRIQNKSSMTICYRIKSLVAGRYQIIPFSGILDCMEAVSITIASANPSRFLKREARQFLVETSLVPSHVSSPSELRLFWKEVPRQEVHESFVGVNRSLHPNHPRLEDCYSGDENNYSSNAVDRLNVSSGDGLSPRQRPSALKLEVLPNDENPPTIAPTGATVGLCTVALGLFAAALHHCSAAFD